MHKTNAMRLLDRAGIPYHILTYPVDENDLSGVHAAALLGRAEQEVFKTLVLRGRMPFVCCIPCHREIDLKKAAAVAGEKRAELLPLKELTPLTGYLRGGCSPVGMKKSFATYFDQSALLLDEIILCAGLRGVQLVCRPEALIGLLGAKTADLVQG